MIKVNFDKNKFDTYTNSISASLKNEYALLKRRAEQYRPKVEKLKCDAVAKFTSVKSRVLTRTGTH